jgi:hypothetical protein
LLDSDFGKPVGLCKEKRASVESSSGGAAVRTFTREWTKATVEMSCGGENNTVFEAKIQMK